MVGLVDKAMNWRSLFVCSLLMCGVSMCPAQTEAPAQEASRPEESPARLLIQERVHFLNCLAAVYDPGYWLSYGGGLYFYPRTEEQVAKLEEMTEARENYKALTNRLARYAIASVAIARSQVGEAWQKKLLLPYSETNLNITPTRELKVRLVPGYEMMTNFGGGDALIATAQEVLFVMDYGRGALDRFHTNAILVREGTKSFKTPEGDYLQAEAFTNAGLNKEETDVLSRVAKACLAEALFPTPTNAMPALAATAPAVRAERRQTAAVASAAQAAPKADEAEEFQAHLMMAKDSSPFMQYLLAQDYLEGRGTAKDEKLGLEWMERAAKNGSGDAKRYMQSRRRE